VRTRITFGTAIVFACALLAGAIFLVTRQEAALTADIQTTVRLRAVDLVAALEGGSLQSSIAIPFENDSFVQIVDASGAVVGSSPNIEGEGRLASFMAQSSGTAARTLDGLPVGDFPFRVVAETAHRGSETLTVYVGTSLKPVDDAVHNLTVALALASPVLLGIVITLTWTAVGRALRPVDQIRAEVANISERELHRRVPQPREHDEIGHLAATMNAMLARLEDSATRKRRFLADASHELRSPLAGIRSQLEVDLTHPDRADWQNTERDVLAETLRMQRLVDDLLALASTDEHPTPARHDLLDVDDLVLTEVRRLRTRGKVTVDARTVAAAQTIGDAHALGRAVRNLLDNAERHATEIVTISVNEDNNRVRIVVRDDGPGVPAGERERIFQRFARADPARSRADGGTGLGLAIARDIVAAHGGTLTLEASDAGATFAIRLPRHPVITP